MIATGAGSETELSRLLGIKQPSIASARRRRQLPPGWIVYIAKNYGVSADWLFFGKGPMKRVENLGPGYPDTGEGDLDLVMIPKVKARLDAGSGSLEACAENKDRCVFRSDWIQRKGQGSSMVLMDVTGDGMSPVIDDGDTVLIDQSQVDVLPGKIYAVAIDHGIVVRRIDLLPGKLVLKGMNKAYEPITVNIREEPDSIKIIGRVIWWCHEA